MDSLGALALATEAPSPELLNRSPYRKKEYVISRKMIKHIVGQTIFQSILQYAMIFAGQLFIPDQRGEYGRSGLGPTLAEI